jgi:two-component system, cell cycle sensor histidine kinase and response regulator CckA
VDSEGPRATGRGGPAVPSTVPEDDPLHWCSYGMLLVVDDDPGVRELLTSLLQRCGFTVLTAGDGQTALEIFRRSADQIRMVLLDFGLPDTDGEAVLHFMRRIRPDLRAILCSGCLTDEAIDQKSREDWSAIIGKPFRLIPFLQTVRKVLED